MKPADEREGVLFREALNRAKGPEREAFLNQACAGTGSLRARLAALLQAHESPDPFLGPQATAPGDATVLVPPEEGPGTLIGRYKILEKIGEGGFGVVYVAEQREPVKRRVALKIIKLGMDTRQVVARFEAERQALALMDHPNIAKVLDAGATDTGRPFFVMELVKGIAITKYCDQEKLGTRERLDLFIAVCHAIQHAHQKGIIHRDIKPSNLLVTLHDGVPVPKVIDFGIAKATQQELTEKTVYTQFQQFIGTPAYMSPEQAEMSGLDIDTRSDIYSLGVLLYELLTGSTPFDTQELLKSGLDEMRKIIREREPVRPSTRLTTQQKQKTESRKQKSEIDADLDWIVMKCLEKDRTRRYETANGVALDIERHLKHEPVVARPPSVGYRLQKSFRRNKLVFTAAGVVGLALVLGAVVSSWQAVEARKAQREAEAARNDEQQQRIKAQSAQKAAETERQHAQAQQQRADEQARNASESEQKSRRLLYASDMNLAQQSLKLNNLGRTRRLLDRHRPQAAEEDLRGWEWRYLWQLSRSGALVTLTNRPTGAFSVSFSPDGRRLAAGWQDGQVDLWDVPARRLVRPLTDGIYPRRGHVAFSPSGNLLAATSGPNLVTLYDLDAGHESVLWRAPNDGEWNVRDLAFSQDGSRLVIYAASTPETGDAVWVVNASSSRIESRHATVYSCLGLYDFGAAQLSPDNQRLYLARSDCLNSLCSIQCIELATDRELWQTEPQRDRGLTTLAISPDGRALASGSGYEDPAIRVWDAATGGLLRQLDGHTAWVSKLAFTRDGRRLISAASDQTIRFWDAATWKETRVLRGHRDEVHAVAISETAHLVASASKDGDLTLWNDEGEGAKDGYSRLPENLSTWDVLALDRSRLLLLPSGKPPELIDLKSNSPPVPLPWIGSSSNVLGCFGANLLCYWNGTNEIRVGELRGAAFIQRGAIVVDSGAHPTWFSYNPARQLLAWSEGPSSKSVYLASLAAPSRRIELKSDVAGLGPEGFSDDGSHLAAHAPSWNLLRVWNVDTGQIVASIDEDAFVGEVFAAGGRVLVVCVAQGRDHEVRFYDLTHPDRAPRRIPGRSSVPQMVVSSDGTMVALTSVGGRVRLFDPAKGELIESLDGHLNASFGVAFSPDLHRLISGGGGREAVKLWDLGARQELLTLAGAGSFLMNCFWSADGNVILAGSPWQMWRAPSWAEIAAAEAGERKGAGAQ